MSHSSCLAYGKRLGGNSLWNMKNKERENNIWLARYWNRNMGGITLVAHSTVNYLDSVISSFFFSNLKEGGREGEDGRREGNCLYSAMIYCVCWSTIPLWQCVAVELQSQKKSRSVKAYFFFTLNNIISYYYYYYFVLLATQVQM